MQGAKGGWETLKRGMEEEEAAGQAEHGQQARRSRANTKKLDHGCTSYGKCGSVSLVRRGRGVKGTGGTEVRGLLW